MHHPQCTGYKLIRDYIKEVKTSHYNYLGIDDLGSKEPINILPTSLRVLLNDRLLTKMWGLKLSQLDRLSDWKGSGDKIIPLEWKWKKSDEKLIPILISVLTHHQHSLCTNTPTYVRTHIFIEDMRTKKVNGCAVTSERANSNVMPTLRGFRLYPYFVA